MAMPVNAVIIFGLRKRLGEKSLDELRGDLLRDIDVSKEDYYNQEPISEASREDGPVPPNSEGYFLYNLNLLRRYYGRDYREGYFPLFKKIAEWIEAKFGEVKIWYGHDVDDENLRLFDRDARDDLEKDFFAHEPPT